jgi:hypothetical protein
VFQVVAGEKYESFSKLCRKVALVTAKARTAKGDARREQGKRMQAKAAKSSAPAAQNRAGGVRFGGVQDDEPEPTVVDIDPDVGVSEALGLVDHANKRYRTKATREAQQNDLEQERRFKQPVYYGRCTLLGKL